MWVSPYWPDPADEPLYCEVVGCTHGYSEEVEVPASFTKHGRPYVMQLCPDHALAMRERIDELTTQAD